MTRNEEMFIRIIDVQLLLKEEHTPAEIARQLDVNPETVRRHRKQFKDSMTRDIAFRDALLWVGTQVERKNLHIIEGQQKISAILDLYEETTARLQ